MSRDSEVLATLSGTMGLMGSSCRSSAAALAATGAVSAVSGTRAAFVVSEFDASLSNSSARMAVSAFRTFRGLSDGWSLNGFTISVRPIARLHGSRGLVSTGAGFAP